jgi:hypothetical protein
MRRSARPGQSHPRTAPARVGPSPRASAFTRGESRLCYALKPELLILRSDPGDDLDPSLVHRLEPLSLSLGILVWDGADEESRLPSLSILLGCRAMMILFTSISVSARRSTADRSSTQCVAADDVFHSLLHASRDCARCGLGCLSRAPLTMLRGYPESAMQFEHCQQNCHGCGPLAGCRSRALTHR